MSYLINKLVEEKKKEFSESCSTEEEMASKLKAFLTNFREIVNAIPSNMQSDFIIKMIISNMDLLGPDGIENATIEYDGMDIIIKSNYFLKECPKSLLQLPRNITDVVVAGNVARIMRRNDRIVINTTTRMVNLSPISSKYAIDFDKLEHEDGFKIGVIKRQLSVSTDSIMSYSELNYCEQRRLKYMKWFGQNYFFTVVDDKYTRELNLSKALEVLSDQDIILDEGFAHFNISSYSDTIKHLKFIRQGEIAPMTKDIIRYFNIDYSFNNYMANSYTIDSDTLMIADKTKTLVPHKFI